MATGDILVSGAFGIEDTTGIDAFLTAGTGLSGAAMCCWQDAGNNGVWFAVYEGAS